ncbi:hypothetical protein GCM10007938_39830 [Vibrio zhanjiangensis]|uniref:Type II toxin-antitoxin system RelE/ParE family toxin n=1 Tax=Vibrio zhanjiangensis TaxID=1046128 RepID=A0ABQ6F3V5_9VIBR|nr:type II toxin-antitoxin system RelE/ParE family toxin [Vibrio zhanjiangensis]GLT20200.1 hypothetical protein GCM10007938_39830 [Vibrio zhanjiangensis]
MTNKVNIQYTETFENSMNDVIEHLKQWSEVQDVIEKVESLLDTFEAQVSENPNIYSRCSELVELGVTNIRDYTRAGFRLLYEVMDEDTVIGLILLRQRQDISMALVDYCILYK